MKLFYHGKRGKTSFLFGTGYWSTTGKDSLGGLNVLSACFGHVFKDNGNLQWFFRQQGIPHHLDQLFIEIVDFAPAHGEHFLVLFLLGQCVADIQLFQNRSGSVGGILKTKAYTARFIFDFRQGDGVFAILEEFLPLGGKSEALLPPDLFFDGFCGVHITLYTEG